MGFGIWPGAASVLLTPRAMAHPSTPLFLIAAVAFAAPGVLSTPVQGLRGAISNSTGEARPVAQANLSVPGDDVESEGGKTCCKNGNDKAHCDFSYNEAGGIQNCRGEGCALHGFTLHCCTPSDVGIAWLFGGCH